MQTSRDDRLLAPTRWVSIIIVPILGAAFVILYVFPDRTTRLWAWTIKSQMTAMMMGGGYLAGAYFFARSAMGRRWHRAAPGFAGAAVFATMLGAGTFIHWDLFNHDHVSFWAWLLLYIATPVLLPWLWVNNNRTDPRTPEVHDAVVPGGVRTLMAVAGTVQMAWSAVMFVAPSVPVDLWAWDLTPLTARTMAAFFAFPAVILIGFAFDDRWSSFRVEMQQITLGLVLLLAAVPRGWDEMSSDTAGWLYATSLVLAIAFLAGVQVVMERRVRGRPAQAAMPPPTTSSPA